MYEELPAAVSNWNDVARCQATIMHSRYAGYILWNQIIICRLLNMNYVLSGELFDLLRVYSKYKTGFIHIVCNYSAPRGQDEELHYTLK